MLLRKYLKPNRGFHFVDFKKSFTHIHPTNIHLVVTHRNRLILDAMKKPCDYKICILRQLVFWLWGKMSMPVNGMGN